MCKHKRKHYLIVLLPPQTLSNNMPSVENIREKSYNSGELLHFSVPKRWKDAIINQVKLTPLECLFRLFKVHSKASACSEQYLFSYNLYTRNIVHMERVKAKCLCFANSLTGHKHITVVFSCCFFTLATMIRQSTDAYNTYVQHIFFSRQTNALQITCKLYTFGQFSKHSFDWYYFKHFIPIIISL